MHSQIHVNTPVPTMFRALLAVMLLTFTFICILCASQLVIICGDNLERILHLIIFTNYVCLEKF